jgi:hypothetical protein
MSSTSNPGFRSKALLWIGRALSALATIFMVLDGIMKLVKPPAVASAQAALGYPDELTPWLGVVALVGALLYAIPRTSILGAIWLTAYFGGAVSAQARIENVSFLFAVAMGIIAWAGLYLRDVRLRALIPVKRSVGRREFA